MLDLVRARFAERVGPPDARGCTPWLLSVKDTGYGQWIPIFGHPVFGKNWLTHRLSWFLERGAIPPGWTIDHTCRNRRCCNVAHLRLLTNVDNAKDNGMSSRTHCPRGHAYEGHNLILARTGHRLCRACRDARNAARFTKKDLLEVGS